MNRLSLFISKTRYRTARLYELSGFSETKGYAEKRQGCAVALFVYVAICIITVGYSGRNNEYYSEDGCLSGIIAAAYSRGAASRGMYTFIKHFAVSD